MSDTQTPSKGAIRAGRNISDRFRRALPNLPDTNANTLAQIIDRETHAGEMAELLREYQRHQASCERPNCECLWRRAERLLKEIES